MPADDADRRLWIDLVARSGIDDPSLVPRERPNEPSGLHLAVLWPRLSLFQTRGHGGMCGMPNAEYHGRNTLRMQRCLGRGPGYSKGPQPGRITRGSPADFVWGFRFEESQVLTNQETR